MAGSRRNFLTTSLALAGTTALPNIVLAQAGAAVVETSNGRVRGRSENGLQVFRGIPYGGDTGGKNRFMPPAPAAKWAGVREAADWGHIAPKPVSAIVPNTYGAMVLNRSYEPAGFALTLGLKDVNLARSAAQGLSVEMPTAELLKQHFDQAVAWGWQDKDWAAIGEVSARKAGV